MPVKPHLSEFEKDWLERFKLIMKEKPKRFWTNSGRGSLDVLVLSPEGRKDPNSLTYEVLHLYGDYHGDEEP